MNESISNINSHISVVLCLIALKCTCRLQADEEHLVYLSCQREMFRSLNLLLIFIPGYISRSKSLSEHTILIKMFHIHSYARTE